MTGTKNNKRYQPLLLVSCNLLIYTAKLGINIAKEYRDSRILELNSTTNLSKIVNIIEIKKLTTINDQNSALEALPLNTVYFLKTS
jgi:hypothetical protein